MKYTLIKVSGEPTEKIVGSMIDREWQAEAIDGEEDLPPVRVLVRHWRMGVDGNGRGVLPIEVYIDGAFSLYPVLVYQNEHLVGMDPGLLYKGKKAPKP